MNSYIMRVGGACIFCIAAILSLSAITVQAASESEGVKAWKTIESVLTHPRCLNCHQIDAPLQGNDGRPHKPRVVRGEDGFGVPVLRCYNCHGSTNNPNSGAPSAGDNHWFLAPLSMNWQGLNSVQLCEMLKDEERNGGRDGAALIEHMDKGTGDPLVLWGWNPGGNLDPVPIPHAEFMGHVKTWVASGQACPKG